MAFNAPDWLIPDWPAPNGVQAVCSTRLGGVSAAPYNSFNLGDHVGDAVADVAANRAQFQRGLGVPPVFLNQVHGTAVVHLGTNTPHGLVADAAVTDQPGVACTIMVADCLPVLLTNRQGTRVGAAHAGWRGLAGEGGRGVLETVFQSFWHDPSVERSQTATKKRADDMLAWLGPCIGPDAFEVGAEVCEAFCMADRDAEGFFRAIGGGKYLADLPGIARHRLLKLGVTAIYGNDGSGDWCTVGNPQRYFSHRRDAVTRGGSGRLAACVWLKP